MGCGGENPAVPYNAGPYCGVLPLTGVGAFGSSSGCYASLPVKWLTVTVAEETVHSNVIEWTTANEFNNDYFTVLKSTDGSSFSAVSDKIKGTGTSSIAKSYSFVDPNFQSAVVYYKIMQTDYDGKSSFSNIVEFYPKQTVKQLDVFVFPNPSASSDEININVFGATEEKDILMVLVDQIGNTLYTKSIVAEYNNFVVALNDVNLKKGVYFISASTDKSVVTKKLVVN